MSGLGTTSAPDANRVEAYYQTRAGVRVGTDDDGTLVFRNSEIFHRIVGISEQLLYRILSGLSTAKRETEIFSRFRSLDVKVLARLLESLVAIGIIEKLPAEPTRAALSRRERGFRDFLSLHVRDGVEQKILQDIRLTRVAIFGAGRLGTRVLLTLISSGFSHISLFYQEPNTLGEDEVALSPLYSGARAGEDRVEVISRKVETQGDICFNAKEYSSIHADLVSEMDFVVAAVDVYDPTFVASLNRWCISNKAILLLPRFDRGKGELISFVPNGSACFTCLRRREAATAKYFDAFDLYVSAKSVGPQEVADCFPPLLDRLAAFVAMECIKLVPFLEPNVDVLFRRRMEAKTFEDYTSAQDHMRLGLPESWGTLLSFEALTTSVSKRTVLKLPRCPDCGVSTEYRNPTIPWVVPW